MNIQQLKRLLKHLWLDAADARRAIPPDMLQRLAKRVGASESRHSGQIRICVEAALPVSYLWRLRGNTGIKQLLHQRAVMLFGKLRVWDTEHNNGVLIYLQLAERAIEIVADRGLSRQVPAAEWQAMTRRMSTAFREGKFEDGLTQALEEVSALLVQHFPVTAGEPPRNELPNEPLVG
ncbi:MAG: TPM domain-containing protein [Pseudomonadota bacterium]